MDSILSGITAAIVTLGSLMGIVPASPSQTASNPQDLRLGGQVLQAQTSNCDSYPNNWPQIAHDASHTGYAAETLGASSKLSWVHKFQPDRIHPQVQPIAYCGSLFITTEGANGESPSVYSLNPSDGTVRWRFAGDAPFVTSVAGYDNTIVAADLNGTVYALQADTTNPNGELVWKKQVVKNKGFLASPVVIDSKIFLGAKNGVFYALDINEDPSNPGQGKVLWETDVGSPIFQTAAADNGQVFVTAQDMKLRALNILDGSINWETGTLNGMAFKDYYPLVHKGQVMIIAMGADPESFDENTGAVEPAVPHGVSANDSIVPIMGGALMTPCINQNQNMVISNGTFQGYWEEYDLTTHAVVDTYSDASGEGGINNRDENTAISCAQNKVVIIVPSDHCGAPFNGWFDIPSHTWSCFTANISSREMRTNTQGGGASQPVISNGWVYHIGYHILTGRNTYAP